MKILVTGGASGLGAAITKELAGTDGNLVYFTYCNSAEKAREIEEEYKNAKGLRCDFDDPSSLNELTEQIPALQIDALINNAMTGFMKKHFHKITGEELTVSFQRNVIPVIQITQAAIQVFKKQRFGKIITILSSALANKPPIGWSEYVANKSYLLAMSKSWATEYSKINITSNCISPAFMLTPLNAETDERILDEMKRNTPLQELLQPDDVAQTVHFLLKSSQQINGVNLLVNQGADLLC